MCKPPQANSKADIREEKGRLFKYNQIYAYKTAIRTTSICFNVLEGNKARGRSYVGGERARFGSQISEISAA